MGQILQLEDFSLVEKIAQDNSDPAALKAVEKLGFDKGYHAGWEDAVTEARSSDQKALADAAAALQQIDFTYFEARQHVMNSFKPLLEAVMGALLPSAAQHALIPLVQEEVAKLAGDLQAPLDIYCAPQTAPVITNQIELLAKAPINIQVEDTLTASQVQLRFSDGMTSVDIDEAVGRIQKAMESFFENSDAKVKLHG